MNKKIIIFTGDPISINSEILYKCWKKINNSTKKKIYVISNFNLLERQFIKLKYPIKLLKVKDIYQNSNDARLKIIDINLKFKNVFKIPTAYSSKFIINSLNYAHRLAQNPDVSGMINCPINKKLLNKANIGVTEYLASKSNIKDDSEVMLIHNKIISVSPITTHIDLRKVSKTISKEKIIKKIKTINKWFMKNLKIKPKIGILGLNPHNAELRVNSEEKKIIIPAILNLKRFGIKIAGPLVSDTIFINSYKKYDVLVGMYHDQILAPFKTLFKFNAINITLGLKYLRVSPDHGVATDLIGKNKADSSSLLECINFLNKYGK